MQNIAQLIHAHPGFGPVFSAVGDVYLLLASGAQTGGAYALFEIKVSPAGGPPPHVHTREDESFYVLEGQITFGIAGQTITAGPGTFLQVPRGTVHYFKNNTDSLARMLVMAIPSGFDEFLQEIATPLPAWNSPPLPVTPADVDRLLSVTPRYGIEIKQP
jgi:quercetin dioxygenase-like cupin family protein